LLLAPATLLLSLLQRCVLLTVKQLLVAHQLINVLPFVLVERLLGPMGINIHAHAVHCRKGQAWWTLVLDLAADDCLLWCSADCSNGCAVQVMQRKLAGMQSVQPAPANMCLPTMLSTLIIIMH
jgi:hypothetical protein